MNSENIILFIPNGLNHNYLMHTFPISIKSVIYNEVMHKINQNCISYLMRNF